MSLFQRVVEFISYPSHSRTLGLLGILAVLLAIPLTVNIAQKQQELRQHAAGQCISWSCEGGCVPNADGSSCQNLSTGATCAGTPTCTQYAAESSSCTPTQAVSCGVNGSPICVGHPENCGKSTTCIDNCGNQYQSQCDACPAPIQQPPAAQPAAQPPAAQPPAAVSCPGNDITTPHSGNTQVWGTACNPSSKYGSSSFAGSIAYAVPGGCTCTVNDCQLYPGTTSTYCWVNNGQSYPDPAGCNAKGANLPASCTASTNPSPATTTDTCTPAGGSCQFASIQACNSANAPKTCATRTDLNCPTNICTVVLNQAVTCTCDTPNQVSPGNHFTCSDSSKSAYCSNNQVCTSSSSWTYPNYPCSVPNSNSTPTPTATPATAGVPCTKPSNPNANACVAPANTCNVTSGTTTVTLDLLNDNTSNCNHQTAYYWPCTPPAPISNCTAPNTCNSSNQCVTPAGSPAPTAAPTPAPAGNTVLTFSNIRLDGIGQGTGQPGSINPPSNGLRPVTVTVLDASGTQITVLTGNILYNNGSWTTAQTISAPPATLPSGSYNFKIKTANYVNKLYSASITGGQANNLTNSVNLPTGDINGSLGVDVNDVNILVSCSIFSKDNGAACGANSAYKGLSDLNNDGKVDQYDYNLILREFGQSDQ